MLNKALQSIRRFHGIKQKDLATKLDISPSHLSEIESGKNTISLDILKKYAEVFDIPASTILLFSEQLENEKGLERQIRVFAADKIIKIMNWLAEKNEQTQ